MNAPITPRNIPRSIGAVLAGFITLVFISVLTDVIMHIAGVFPPMDQRMTDAQCAIAFAYRLPYGILGCYIAAWLAPRNPMFHAMALACVGLFVSTAGAVAMWDCGPNWYPVALIVTTVPSAWIAGKLFQKRNPAPAVDPA